jgi:hypothetical protein
MVFYSDLYFKSPQIHVFKIKNYGYFRQFIFSQPDSQISCQTLKLKTAAFTTHQLSLDSQPATAQTNRPSAAALPPQSVSYLSDVSS